MSNNSQNICIHYGFCCDGTLFNHVNIKEHEPIAKEYLFEITEKEKRAFKQLCPYFTNNICVIYAERPYTVCEAFQCKLLKALRTGKISYDDAMKIIDQVTNLKKKIEHQLTEHHPKNKSVSVAAKMKEFNLHFQGTMNEVEFRKKYGEIVLDYFMFNSILDTNFKSKRL